VNTVAQWATVRTKIEPSPRLQNSQHPLRLFEGVEYGFAPAALHKSFAFFLRQMSERFAPNRPIEAIPFCGSESMHIRWLRQDVVLITWSFACQYSS
jgi:hypothetical protein